MGEPAATTETPVFYSIGHSTRPLDLFIELLKKFEILLVADVRTVPRSRNNPQYNKELLPQVLASARIGYRHLPELGGLRHPRKDSINVGWRTDSFRGYADYMGTEEFSKGVERLITLSKEGAVVIMCAEAVPWRCHRSLIADALLVRGIATCHITGSGSCLSHKLTSFAKVEENVITYPAFTLAKTDAHF